MRIKKTGSDRQLAVMASFSRTLKELPAHDRNQIVNWLASQDWSDEQPVTPVQPAAAALS